MKENDYISREEVISQLEYCLANFTDYKKALEETLDKVKHTRTISLPKGHWIRMSDLSEQEDDRYKCSHCGNVVHHRNKMNLYTFNSWCGRCGSDNGRRRGE